MSYKRDVPKLNKDKFLAWKELMRLNLSTIGDNGLNFLDNSIWHHLGLCV